MEIIDLEQPNVLIIKNFFSKEEVEKVLIPMKETSEEIWNLQGEAKKEDSTRIKRMSERLIKSDNMNWYGMTMDITSRVDAYRMYSHLPHAFLIEKEQQIKKIITNKFKQNVVLQLSGLHRWRPGREQKPHIDYYDSSEQHDFDMLEKYNLTKDRLEEFEHSFNDKHYSSLVYFNEDYMGGELYMPQWDWEIKPETGMLIAFEGNQNHLHGVKMMEEGIRYTWSIFWTRFEWAMKNKIKDSKVSM